MKWEVIGAERDTGRDVRVTIEADTEASARRRANRAGILVDQIRQLDPDDSAVGVTGVDMAPVKAQKVTAHPVEALHQSSDSIHDEKEILKAGQLLVTSKRLVVGTKTYSMANITTVEMHKFDPNYDEEFKIGCGLPVSALVCAGVLFGVGGIATCGGWFCTACSIAGPALAILSALKKKKSYALIVTTNSGQIDVFRDADSQVVMTIVKAIDAAISARA